MRARLVNLILIPLLAVFVSAGASADTKGYRKNCLEGAGCMDAIDGAALGDGDHCNVAYGGHQYLYVLDADSAASESGVEIIAPSANAGDKRWIRQDAYRAAAGDSATGFFTDGTMEDDYLPTVSDSTGGILPSTSGASDGWLAVVQDDGSIAYEDGTGEVARAMAKITRDAAQSIPNDAATKVSFDNIEYDNFGMADVTSNYRIDIPRDGKYSIVLKWVANGVDDGETGSARIYVNGVQVAIDQKTGAKANDWIPVEAIVQKDLDAGDYVEGYVKHNEGGAIDTQTSMDSKVQLSVTQLDSDFTGDSGKHSAVMTRNAVQTIPSNTTTKIAFDNVIYDVGDIADYTTNDRFDIARTGIYCVDATWLHTTIDDNEYVITYIYLNGGVITEHYNRGTGTDNYLTSSSYVCGSFSAGDYIEMYVKHNEGADYNTHTGSGKPKMSVIQVDGVDYGDRGPTTVACADATDTCAYTEGFGSYYLTSGSDSAADTMTIDDGFAGQKILFKMKTDGGDDISVEFTNGTDCDDFTAAGDFCFAEFDGTNWFIINQGP